MPNLSRNESLELDELQEYTPLYDQQGINSEGPRSQQSSSADHYQVPQIALALIEVDEWEIHPVNVYLGHKIGEGYWGQVHRSLIKSVAIRKVRDVIPDFLKYQRIVAAVKILKGILKLQLSFNSV